MGLGVVLYLAVTNMTSVIGASRTAANIALGIIVVIAALGAGLAAYYRSSRPEIYARIGRQEL